MTVSEAIEQLKKLPDKEIEILLDCTRCGNSQQLASFDEILVMRGKEKIA